MRRVLLSWVGNTDLKAAAGAEDAGLGPLGQAMEARPFDEAILLSNFPDAQTKPFVKWLSARSGATEIELVAAKLTSPTNFGEIYEAVVRACAKVLAEKKGESTLTFHLSPGTPAMAAVWIILAKTRFPAELIESSRQHGVRSASVPFDISADFIPDLLREQDERLRRQSGEEPPLAPEFADIIHRSRPMDRLIHLARRVAARSVPVLIEGESGTGKELLARAIHRASPRRDKPFVTVNCGAIPSELVESELFGHEKGAFTGAVQAKKGYFESADRGTLFLDEIGELPKLAQVKMLRALQEGEVVHVGATKPIKVDVRVIAATNRTLTEEISAGRFREDLFFRLAVAILKLPPLRDRTGDVGLLVDHLLEQINKESVGEPGFRDKKLSAGAKSLLLGHPWPGNVRELQNTLRRAAIWSDEEVISLQDAREALLVLPSSSRLEVLGRPLGNGLDLPKLLDEVERHYLERAMQETGGNKTKAAELVGAPSYQTFSNWLRKYDVKA